MFSCLYSFRDFWKTTTSQFLIELLFIKWLNLYKEFYVKIVLKPFYECYSNIKVYIINLSLGCFIM